jgi:hypothetical protein
MAGRLEAATYSVTPAKRREPRRAGAGPAGSKTMFI